jgi:Flp pilus assembly protein TadD
VSTNDQEAMRLGLGAVQAMARGDKAEAARLAGLLLKQRPSDANANQVLGVLALMAGDHATARAHLQRADAAAPGQVAILNALGSATRGAGDLARARALFTRAGELGLADAWRNLGNLEQAARDHIAAIAAFQRAAHLAPDDARAHAGMAHSYEERHDTENARVHAERALRLAPDNEIARIALARVLLREDNFAEAEATAAPVAQGKSAINRAVAAGIVGEARDKSGAARGAFAAFTEANRALLERHGALLEETGSPYHPESIRRLIAFAEDADVSRWAAPADAGQPIFLVGFPRSGTTLLDQILSSHSRFFCVEEKECLALTIGDLAIDDEKLAAGLSSADAQVRRAAYLHRLSVEAGAAANGRRVIDKLPLNLVFLPLIRRLFPDAKIIFAMRDPRDVVLSCYQQRFGMNPAMAQFLQLETAAAYYDAVMRLYEVSFARMDLAIHVVRYEGVVADLEGTARGLTAFLGAPFEPAMLAFRETALKRNISTPSARQVTQPLYGRSVGRWRKYAEDLAPVLPVLNVWAERFGYDV